MSDIIQLKKDGFYVSEYNKNMKLTELVQIDRPLWYYYNHELGLDEGITCGDIFSSLEPLTEAMKPNLFRFLKFN